MRFNKLTVEGFESATDKVEVDLRGKDMVAFVGKNGAGKSMLSLWAPIFALYGKTRHRNDSKVISSNAGQAMVELEFSIGDNEYKVIRKLPRVGSHEATLFLKDDQDGTWEVLENKNASSTTKRIIQEIGMDFNAARTTFMALQGEYGMFAESLPSKRREILTQLLDLDSYAELKDSADKQLKSGEVEIASYTSQLEEIERLREILHTGADEFKDLSDEDLLDEVNALRERERENAEAESKVSFQRDNADAILRNSETALAQFETNKANRIKLLEDTLTTLSKEQEGARLTALENEQNEIREAKMYISKLQDGLETTKQRIVAGETKIAETEEAKAAVADKGSAAKARLEALSGQIQELRDQYTALKSSSKEAHCQTCTQPLTEDLLAVVTSKIQEEAKEKKSESQKAEAEISSLKEEYTTLAQQISKFKDFLSHLNDEKDKASQNLARLNQVVQRESAVEASIAQERENLETIQTRIGAAERDLKNVRSQEPDPQLLADIEAAKKHVDAVYEESTVDLDYSYTARLAAVEKEIAQRDNARDKESQLDTRKKSVEDKLTHAQNDVEHYKVLSKAFAATGIPAMILAGVVPELEQDANVYLDKFSNGELSLNIETERLHAKGTKAEEILITVNAPDGTREYGSFSGGQKFRIDLAIRIAMCKVAARRNGSNAVETFFIDEGFGALDDEGQGSTLEALAELSAEMSVVAVSHINSVKDEFPHLIEVSLDTGTTTARETR